jgi:hypothetical protein
MSELLAALSKLLPTECIDGDNVREVGEKYVDLDVEFTPVIDSPLCGDPATTYCNIPKPVRVQREGDRFCLVYPETNNFRWTTADAIKTMRSRYLLLRGYYAKRLEQDTLMPREKDEVLAWYFPNGFLNFAKLKAATL